MQKILRLSLVGGRNDDENHPPSDNNKFNAIVGCSYRPVHRHFSTRLQIHVRPTGESSAGAFQRQIVSDGGDGDGVGAAKGPRYAGRQAGKQAGGWKTKSERVEWLGGSYYGTRV